MISSCLMFSKPWKYTAYAQAWLKCSLIVIILSYVICNPENNDFVLSVPKDPTASSWFPSLMCSINLQTSPYEDGDK
jgi:hypothetical protein